MCDELFFLRSVKKKEEEDIGRIIVVYLMLCVVVVAGQSHNSCTQRTGRQFELSWVQVAAAADGMRG